MSDETAATETEFHKKMAVELFNKTWELLDKKERTAEEDDLLVHAGHASRYHWGVVGTPTHVGRGEQQLSHIYAVLGRAEPALYHARRCLDICTEHKIGDFDIAFAHEAMARSLALAGNSAEAEKHIAEAKKAAADIKDPGDKDYFLSQLKTVPGYRD
jgi:tetratricopeptide (TPR) repeat protein